MYVIYYNSNRLIQKVLFIVLLHCNMSKGLQCRGLRVTSIIPYYKIDRHRYFKLNYCIIPIYLVFVIPSQRLYIQVYI